MKETYRIVSQKSHTKVSNGLPFILLCFIQFEVYYASSGFFLHFKEAKIFDFVAFLR